MSIKPAGSPGLTGATLQAIDVRGLQMRYDTVEVLSGLDLTVQRGEVLVLLGPNGAGKTTTVEILEGFRFRSGGDVSVLGADPARGDEQWRSRLGVVLQSWRDHSKWRVLDLLQHLGRYYTPYSTPDRPRPYAADELIDMVGLGPQARQKVGSLSGGQRRRLDVAIGIVGRPELLFMDEPTTGFDPEARREFHNLVRRLSDLEDTSILLTTHDLDEAAKLADRIVIMAGGRVVANGTVEALNREVSGESEVRWRRNGESFARWTDDATGFVRELLTERGGDITDLQIRQNSLEDTYMALLRKHEASTSTVGPTSGVAA